ncbi:MAG: c-type cytochrome [Parasphingorhabdus sp.]|uniref:c-type cytochrome n=1 Tax=Parasphingorhabdus sp. TaxID=2709688 RepID=UPI003001CB87
MRAYFRASALATVITLSACGSDPTPEPVEQIVVREPNATDEKVGEVQDAAPSNASADLIASGKTAFNTCAVCHTVEKGAGNRIGPNLNRVIGRTAGSVTGFSYSGAMKSSGITWTKAEISSFLTNPAAKVSGTTMMIGPIADAAKREAIIAYIENASAN